LGSETKGWKIALIVAAENPPTDRIKKWMYENFGQNWKKQKNANLAAVRRTKSSDICCHLQSKHQILSESIWKSLGSYQNPTITSK